MRTCTFACVPWKGFVSFKHTTVSPWTCRLLSLWWPTHRWANYRIYRISPALFRIHFMNQAGWLTLVTERLEMTEDNYWSSDLHVTMCHWLMKCVLLLSLSIRLWFFFFLATSPNSSWRSVSERSHGPTWTTSDPRLHVDGLSQSERGKYRTNTVLECSLQLLLLWLRSILLHIHVRKNVYKWGTMSSNVSLEPVTPTDLINLIKMQLFILGESDSSISVKEEETFHKLHFQFCCTSHACVRPPCTGSSRR